MLSLALPCCHTNDQDIRELRPDVAAALEHFQGQKRLEDI